MAGKSLRSEIEERLKFGHLKLAAGGENKVLQFPAEAEQQQPRRSPDALRPDLLAITNAAHAWAHSTTNTDLDRAPDIIRDKLRVVSTFFVFADVDILDVTPIDVMAWQEWLEREKNLAARTVYNYSSHLSSFYQWLRSKKNFARYLPYNPVRAVFPKNPEAYQTRSSRSLSDASLKALWRVMEKVKKTGSVIGHRDYALFRFFVATGDRRAEILNLRGEDIELFRGGLIYYPRAKGGRTAGKTINDKEVKRALIDYIKKSGRTEADVIGRKTPLWLAHDGANDYRLDPENFVPKALREFFRPPATMALARSGARAKGLTARAFAGRMKKYAELAHIFNFHLHQFRHTFARIVAEDTRSLSATQEALGHQHQKTTKAYVQNIEIRGDLHSDRMKKRIRRR